MTRYLRPASTADALSALATEGDGARALVGGTDLLVALRHHTIEPSLIVDLKAVADMPEPIAVGDDGVRVGPTLTMGELAAHPVVRRWYPALVEAALTVGSVAIRNRASLVGNACNGSPAADTVPALLVHGASITIASRGGERTVSLNDFFLGPRRTGMIEQSGVALDPRGNVKADTSGYASSEDGVFTCGDMRRGQSLVVWAIREGRQCARAIDLHLMGQSNLPA